MKMIMVRDGWVPRVAQQKEKQLSTIKFDQFIAWFENSVLMVSKAELHRLNRSLDDITDGVLYLKRLSVEYRNSLLSIQPSNNQAPSIGSSNRILKLYDHIDSLTVPFIAGRLYSSHLHDTSESGRKDVVYHVTSLLPDYDVLKDYSNDLKHKLKILDEMASSRKNDSTKNKAGSKGGGAVPAAAASTHNTSVIKDEVKMLQSALEQLIMEISKKVLVLRYFRRLKLSIHPPIQKLSLKMMKLPSLTDISKHLDEEYHNLKSADELYANMKSTECLVRVKRLQMELLHLEEVLMEAYQPLKRIGRSLAQSLAAFIDVSTELGSDDDSNNNCSRSHWLEDLSSLHGLSTADILRQLTHAPVKNSFIQSLDLLQQMLIAHPNSLRAACPTDNFEGLVEYIIGFDVDLFIAHLDDWTGRLQLHGKPANYGHVRAMFDVGFIAFVDSLVRKSEFVRSYQQLVSARKALDQCRHRYELCMYHFKEAVTMHTQVGAHLHQLKDKFAEVQYTVRPASLPFCFYISCLHGTYVCLLTTDCFPGARRADRFRRKGEREDTTATHDESSVTFLYVLRCNCRRES